jgi:D-beta-D-heptose 7-phosphate kinase/D-beta-D-heptose 1-phosphate adenosyltransferase
MQPEALKKIISHFPKARIMVIGDLILDEYVWGKVERISPEAPVPVVWANKRTYVPGGAANVANNLRSLDAEVLLVGVIGHDHSQGIFLSELKKRQIPSSGLFVSAKRHTTVKTRVIAGHQQVVRVDWEHTEPLDQKMNQGIYKFIRKKIKDFDAIIIEDYGKGVVNRQMLEGLIFLGRAQKKIVTVDPKEEHFQYYRGITSMTPNRKELENAVRNLKISDTANQLRLNNDRLFSDKEIETAAGEIMHYLDMDSLLVTLGEQGMKLFERGGHLTHIPTVAQEVFDVSGAGDTVISTFTLGLASGASKKEAAYLANFAAGIVVGKVGTAVTTRKELRERIKNS